MIYVKYAGCDTKHHPGSIIESINGNDEYLLIITKTNAIIELDGEKSEMPLGALVLFDKHVPYCYWNSDGEYIDDWVHFDFKYQKPSFEDLSIPLNTVLRLNNLSALTLITNQIVKELYSSSVHKDNILDNFMHILLLRISEQIKAKDDPIISHHLYPQMSELRTQIYNLPGEDWTVKKMCSIVHISESYFQHLYKKMFKTSCINDVINARIESAKYYLRRTNTPIKDISDKCGYENGVHFSRQFKKKIGLTPRDYRNMLTSRDYIKKTIY